MLRDRPRTSERDQLERRIRRMERQNLALFSVGAVLAATLAISIAKTDQIAVKAAEPPTVLRVKGLVIEDQQGRARILVGAPFPAVSERVRRDETTAAMVFLDEQGHDRFAVGEKFAPQIDGRVPENYQKAGTGYGLTLFDLIGNERGGMGFLSSAGNASRVVMVLDRPEGDAIGAIVDDKTGYAGLAALYAPRETGVEATGILLGTQGNKAFLSMQDPQNQPRASLSVESKQLPALQVFDANGKSSQNLLHPGDPTMTDFK